jgi:cytochrome bd ubiquinol oxidase subunit II
MTVTQAAAGRSTLVALVIGVSCGAVVLAPSLVLLFTLFLRGRLDTPEHHAPEITAFPGGAPAPPDGLPPATGPPRPGAVTPAGGPVPAAGARPAHHVRAWSAAAAAGLVAGAGLLVFADSAWAHVIGVACLVLCAVSAFVLAVPPPSQP